MKQLLALLLAALMLTSLLSGCGMGQTATTAPVYDNIKDECVSPDGTYEIAFVTDKGQLKDLSFSQSIWEGVKLYAFQNGKTYKYYQPDNHHVATDDDRYNAMKKAIDNGAKLVFCAGYLHENALTRIAMENPQVHFVFIDGFVLKDSLDVVMKNVAAIRFREEQAGYLAGYAAVMEGSTRLGFSGGGDGVNEACIRFGHGYLQGIQAAAAEKNIKVDVNFSWAYGKDFAASAQLQNMLSDWYAGGTQVIFSCGGLMCQSAFAAAAAKGGKVIGVDVDQSAQSDTVITSATKGLREAVQYACAQYYSNKWAQIGGVQTVLGAAENSVGLPTTNWKLQNFTAQQYEALLAKLKDGSVSVDAGTVINSQSFPNVNLTMVEEPVANTP